jgi:pilus assembly protein CpaC
MTHRTLIATESLVALLVAVIAAVGFVVTEQATAAEPHIPVMKVTSSDETARFVPLGIGKSVVIDLPRDIKDVLVSDPKIANAVARSSRKSTSRGVAIGQTKSFSSMPMISRSAGLTAAVRPAHQAGSR